MSNIKEIEEREVKNQEEAKGNPLVLNYVGEWEQVGVISEKGKLWSHNELWTFTTKYKYMQRLANLVDIEGKCILGNKERLKIEITPRVRWYSY